MKKILAISPDDSHELVYGGVKWFIKPLPYGVKKQITKNSIKYASKSEMEMDLVDMSMLAVKYGLVGWEGFEYKDGRKAECKKEKDKDGIECLTQETLELIYRTSAFDVVSICCVNNSDIPKYMEDAVEWDKQQAASIPPLDDDKKK